MSSRTEQIAEMYTLVYGYSREEAHAQLAMHNAQVLAMAVQSTKGMSPLRHYGLTRLTLRRKQWWSAGVRQAQDALYGVVMQYEKVERDHYEKNRKTGES